MGIKAVFLLIALCANFWSLYQRLKIAQTPGQKLLWTGVAIATVLYIFAQAAAATFGWTLP